MVDSPRAARPLLRNIESMGGVRRMLLTHQDDVADHAKFAARFGCERVIHRVEARGSLADIEVQLDIDEPEKLDEDLWVIPVPGHTRGSVAYLYRQKYLFSGDHLWWSANVGALHASRRVCWYDWRKQIESMERLLAFKFRVGSAWARAALSGWFGREHAAGDRGGDPADAGGLKAATHRPSAERQEVSESSYRLGFRGTSRPGSFRACV